MSIAWPTRCAGVLAIAFGIGAAAMTHPGIVFADPTAEPSPGSSQVESPGTGVPDSKTELGVVSSGGSTPAAGAGSVGAGSGFDTSSGPGQAATSTGFTDTVTEPSPGVVVRSSGGALTSDGDVPAGTGQQHVVAPDQTTPRDSSAVDAPSVAQVETSTTEATPTPAATLVTASQDLPVAAIATGSADAAASRAHRVVIPAIFEIASSTVPLRDGDGSGGDGAGAAVPPVVEPGGGDDAVGVETMGAPRPVEPAGSPSAQESLRTFTGVLAAVLAPFVVPLPGGPVDAPTLWAVLAWTRRQSERGTSDDRSEGIAAARQTEEVIAVVGADAPGATVDRIDHATGRVTGRVNVVDVTDDDRDGLTYALVGKVDRRLGVVTVNGSTGAWTFTPTPVARLAAHVEPGGGPVTFSIAVSNGLTVDVRAPVDPAEAVVTDTIDVGDGLTYGMAAVGDRLYVLNGSDGAAGNGYVKIIDTATRTTVGSVEVGSMPVALAVSGRTLYVGNGDDGTVSVVDVASNTVVDVIGVGANPIGLEVSGDRLYVADHAGTVSVIDLANNTELARIPVGGDPFGVAATADRLYVTNYAGGTVAVLDRATHTAVGTALVTAEHQDPVGYPYVAAVSGGRLYVVNAATNALTIVDRSITTTVDVDPTTRALDAVPGDAAPVDMVVRGDRLYVSNVNRGTVAVLDVATNQPVENIGVGIQPGLITATRDGRTVYVADVMSGTVRVISSVRHATR